MYAFCLHLDDPSFKQPPLKKRKGFFKKYIVQHAFKGKLALVQLLEKPLWEKEKSFTLHGINQEWLAKLFVKSDLLPLRYMLFSMHPLPHTAYELKERPL